MITAQVNLRLVDTHVKGTDMKDMKALCIIALGFLLALPAFANPHAEGLVEALNATSDSVVCSVKSNSKTILCIANAADGELDQIARGVVFMANSHDIPLSGWKLTMVNRNDYVVTLPF